MSIRIAGELVALSEREQRAKVLRIIKREEKYLHDLLTQGFGVMHGDIEGAFHRIREDTRAKRKQT